MEEESLMVDAAIVSSKRLRGSRTIGHVVPFALWVGVILLLQALELCMSVPRIWLPYSYALKTVVCGGLFLWYQPWLEYPRLSLRHLPLAVAAGVLVALLWILPETPQIGRTLPQAQAFYHRWLIMVPGVLPDYYNSAFYPSLPPQHLALAYSPQEAGWLLTLMKLFGSAGVIAVIEEFFFRGFFYRWLRKAAFWEVSPSLFDLQAFMTVAVIFALEHDRWFAGLLAGLVYGALALRGGVWSAALAHVVTNLLLGLYVIASGQYGFW